MPFSMLPGELYIGRAQALADLTRFAEEEAGGPRSLFLEGPRGIGKTELLRQLYTVLFWKQEKVVPFHYSISPALTLVEDLAHDHLVHFLCQWFGFERREPELVLSDDLGLDELYSLALARGAEWAARLLDRFRSPSATPLDLLRAALHAPRTAARASGRPVVVLLDDLHLLAGLRRASVPEPHLAALFADLMTFPRTPHIVAGLAPAIDALQLPVLKRYALGPLALSDAELLVRSLLRTRQIVSPPVPRELLLLLGGNPGYLTSVAASLTPDSVTPDSAYWNAYRQEAEQGTFARSVRAVLRAAFPDGAERRSALEALHAVVRRNRTTGGPLTDRTLSALVPTLLPSTLPTLVRTGLLCGEFGTYVLPEDGVLPDVVAALYAQDIEGSAAGTSRGPAAAREHETASSFTVELLLPHAPEAELVAAQCLEQLGRNRKVPDEVIGQLQIALIEACVNALEHGAGGKPVPVRIQVAENDIAVSVSSIGRDFVLDGTGEPASTPHPGGELRRGWGVTLMKRFCDDVRFERTAQGTTVVLRKRWSPDARTDTKENRDHEQFHPFPEE
jgi:anti-sigma regulatory factor (Ser/Thr protein kinase)